MARVRGGKYEDHGVRITEDGKNVYISSLMWNQNGKGSALIYLNKLTVKSISNIDKISAGDSTSSAMKQSKTQRKTATSKQSWAAAER